MPEDKNPIEETFFGLVEQVFREQKVDVDRRVAELIDELQKGGIEDARQAFQQRPASGLFDYVKELERRDLFAEFRALLTAETPTQTVSKQHIEGELSVEKFSELVPKILAEYGYVSEKAIAPKLKGSYRHGNVGAYLSRISRKLNLVKSSGSPKGDMRFVPKGEKKQKKAQPKPEDRSIDKVSLIGYMETTGEIDPLALRDELGLGRRNQAIALIGNLIYQQGTEGWTREKRGDRYVYTKLLYKKRIDTYVDKILSVSEKKDRFTVVDIDPENPELVEILFNSKIAGNGTFAEREGITAVMSRGVTYYTFKPQLKEEETLEREVPKRVTSYRVTADGLVVTDKDNVESGRDYMDRIGR